MLMGTITSKTGGVVKTMTKQNDTADTSRLSSIHAQFEREQSDIAAVLRHLREMNQSPRVMNPQETPQIWVAERG